LPQETRLAGSRPGPETTETPPFLAVGQRVQVKHRDYMFVPPNALVMVVADDQGGFRTIDTALVTELRWRGRVKAA
jgi:hypothetical protein